MTLTEKAIQKFYNITCNIENSRNLSWEYYYKVFHDARNRVNPDHDYLSLQLSFYLASWGMYRGSSFLLERDYNVHIGAVKMILDKEYDCLAGAEYNSLIKDETISLLIKLCDSLKEYYSEIRESVLKSKDKTAKTNISQTLLSKILLGTMGCVPAYDEFLTSELKKYGFNYNLCEKSIRELAEYYKNNSKKLEEIRQGLFVYDLKYPQMKLLDMGFWQMRKDIMD